MALCRRVRRRLDDARAAAYCVGLCAHQGSRQHTKEMNLSSCTFGKSIALPFEAAVDRVASELAILGACNPQFANQALVAEPQIGALLPCNVVVRVDAAGSARIEFINPNAMLRLVDRPDVARLAGAVRLRLGKSWMRCKSTFARTRANTGDHRRTGVG